MALHYLDVVGIRHAGAGRNLSSAAAPAIVDIAGKTVGVIALTDKEPVFAAGADSPGTNYQKIRTLGTEHGALATAPFPQRKPAQF